MNTTQEPPSHTTTTSTKIKIIAGFIAILAVFGVSYFSDRTNGPQIFGVRSEYALFVITLLGIALLHTKTFEVAFVGLFSVTLMKLFFVNDFAFLEHLSHEAQELFNLFGLLLGFAVLAKHFEDSHMPEKLAQRLPSGWVGGFALLAMVFVLSALLDNIAAAMIGGTIALTVFKKNVHIGYVAAIVACSNAGGAGSVVGDTTTTMMWLKNMPATEAFHAYWAAVPALFISGIIGSIQQDKLQPLHKDNTNEINVQWTRIIIVALILVGAVLTNIYLALPAVGVWAAILIGALIVKTPWGEVPKSLKSTFFLLSLVLCASMMPVENLPKPSTSTAFGLGFLSSVFDNIPLTKLAIEQNNYDWGVLAFAVGFGGSMTWFGSSAGVAVCNTFAKARSIGNWLKSGWHVIPSYVIGFIIMILIAGWNPTTLPETKKGEKQNTEIQTTDTDSTESNASEVLE